MTVSSTTRIQKTGAVPVLGVPFLEAFRVTYGPPGILGRFFLVIDERLRQQGISMSFVPLDEFVEAFEQNAKNWGFFNPMFDPRVAYLPEGRLMVLAGKNAKGEIVATSAGKLFDTSSRSFKEIVDSGEFFGIKPEHNSNSFEARLQSPTAEAFEGKIGYCGGIWVRPDYRGLNLPALFATLINACMQTMWNPDYIVGFVRNEVIGTNLHDRYGFKHHEPSLVISQNGTVLIEAALLWMTAADTSESVGRFLDVLWPKIDAGIVSRDRQKTA